MAEEALVAPDVGAAHRLIERLDGDGLGVRSALFVLPTDRPNWRLWIDFAKPLADRREAYRRIARVFAEHGDDFGGLDSSDIELVDRSNRALAALADFVHLPGRGQVHFSNNVFNGVYLPEAIVLRMDR